MMVGIRGTQQNAQNDALAFLSVPPDMQAVNCLLCSDIQVERKEAQTTVFTFLTSGVVLCCILNVFQPHEPPFGTLCCCSLTYLLFLLSCCVVLKLVKRH